MTTKRILWLCTHRTQWREELPLLLDAGFEVVPARLPHQTYPVVEKPDDPYYVQTWRDRCTLPPDVLERLRSVNWFHEAPADVVPLAREAFSAVLVTSFIDTLLLVTDWFPGDVYFRVFGLAGMDTYTNTFGPEALRQLRESKPYRAGRYHWCPILPTLSHAEDETLIENELTLEAFVSPERLPACWDAASAEPYAAVVLSKAAEVGYYRELYQRITTCFRLGEPRVPLRILGQNQPGGGLLRDPEIVGSEPDDAYFHRMARAAAFFYQGESVCHLHWSVLEALAMGVPVVMLSSGYVAHALRRIVGPQARGRAFGVVEGLDEAKELLADCIQDVKVREGIARRQRPFRDWLTDRKAAAAEYRRLLRVA